MPDTYFAFCEPAVVGYSGLATWNTTAASDVRFRSGYVRGSHVADQNNFASSGANPMKNHVLVRWPSALSELWLAFRARPVAVTSAASSGYSVLELVKSGTAYLRLIKVTATTNVQWQRLVSGTWTNIGSAFAAISAAAQTKIDIQVLVHASAGIIRTYYGGSLVDEQTGLNTQSDNPGTTIDGCNLGNYSDLSAGTNLTDYSEVVVSSVDTRGKSAKVMALSGSGSDSGWTGAHTDINAAPRDDTTGIVAASADLVSTFATGGLGAGSDLVAAVIVAGRAARGPSAPTQANLAVRVGSTNYFSSNIAVAQGLGGIQNAWPSNPAGGAWTRSAAGGNVGVKSIA